MLSLSVESLDPRPKSALSFDAGINASSAWTGARESVSNGDDLDERNEVEKDGEDEDPPPRPARALFDFDGKPDFREL